MNYEKILKNLRNNAFKTRSNSKDKQFDRVLIAVKKRTLKNVQTKTCNYHWQYAAE